MSSEFSDPPLQARHSLWWLVLAALLVLVGADQVFRLVLHSRTQNQLAQFKSQGYPVNVFDLESWRPAPPDKANAAVCVLEAADYLDLPRTGINSDKFPTRREPLDADE